MMPLASPIGSGLGLLNPYSHSHDQASTLGPRHRRRRRRHRERRVHHDGAGRRRHPDEHRARRGRRIPCAWRTRCGSPSTPADRRISRGACRAARWRCRRRPRWGCSNDGAAADPRSPGRRRHGLATHRGRSVRRSSRRRSARRRVRRARRTARCARPSLDARARVRDAAPPQLARRESRASA